MQELSVYIGPSSEDPTPPRAGDSAGERALAALDFVPPFSIEDLSARQPVTRTNPAGLIRLPSDEMTCAKGDHITMHPGSWRSVEPAPNPVTAGVYVVLLARSGALMTCRLQPQPSGLCRVSFDNPAYHAYEARLPSQEMRPLFRVVEARYSWRHSAPRSTTEIVAAARAAGLVPDWHRSSVHATA